MRVGGPGLPVMVIDDEMILRSRPQDLDPFPPLRSTWNAITAQYPDPEKAWEPKDAPIRTNADWEAADRHGRLPAEIRLPAVPYDRQVQRIMRGWIEAERCFLRHGNTLPPEAAILEPLDVIAWVSERNQYAAKQFDLTLVLDELFSCIQQVGMLETDPSDWAWQPDFILPVIPGDTNTPTPPAPVPGWTAGADALQDADGADRRPRVWASWEETAGGDGLRIYLRRAGDTSQGQAIPVNDLAAGRWETTDGILPNTSYQLAARLVANRPTELSAWITVTTPDVRFGMEDLGPSATDLIEGARQDAADAKDAAERIQNEVGEAIEDAIKATEAARDAALAAAGNADEILIAALAAREDTEAFKLAAEAAEEGATSAFASTITARDATEAYRNASLAAQNAAELARTEAQSHASAAGGSATAAAGSATTAASHSTAAGNSATAAAARVLEATAARDAAQGHASAANTSASAAGTSAAASQARPPRCPDRPLGC